MSTLKDLTREEVEKLAKTPIPEDKLKDLPYIRRFIIACQVYEGTTAVSAVLVYNRYLEWAQKSNEPIVTQQAFSRQFKLYFIKKRAQDGFYYMLNPEGFDLEQGFKIPRKRNSVNGKKKSSIKEKTTEE